MSSTARGARHPGERVWLGLNVLTLGYAPAAWQSERLQPHAFIDPDTWTGIARLAERGTLDALFLADILALGDVSHDANPWRFDPFVTWSAVAAATERIGLIATNSTTYNDPWNLAERILSLDHVSGGRAAWNVVTTRDSATARNYGLTATPQSDRRYERAAEFVDVVTALWHSARTGVPIAHRGAFFTVDGVLPLPPSPQGAPVLFQAGGSPAGREIAGRRADGVFTAELTKDAAIEHYGAVQGIAHDEGRRDGPRIVPGVLLSLASTDREARRRADELFEAGPTDYPVQWLSAQIGFDVSALPLDAPFPDTVLEAPVPDGFEGSRGFRESIFRKIRATRPTVREYLRETRYEGSGHLGFVGTPERLADLIEDWFVSRACDGFNLQPDVLADGLEIIVDELVPILRRRGLFHHDYAAPTLRGRLRDRLPALTG